MLGVIEEEGAMGVGSGYNGPLCALDSLSLLDFGLPLPVRKPPTGLDKYQDIWKINLVICFWPLCSCLDYNGPRWCVGSWLTQVLFFAPARRE